MKTDYAIEVSNLTKKYGELVAVDHINDRLITECFVVSTTLFIERELFKIL